MYILRCADGSLYTGATNRLDARVNAHAQGKGARYTRSRRPVALLFHEPVGEKGAALSRELALKKLTRAEKLALIATATEDRRRKAPRRPKPAAQRSVASASSRPRQSQSRAPAPRRG